MSDPALDPAQTALLVVDMQNTFCDPGGAAAKAGLDIDALHAIIPNVRRLAEAAHAVGMTVFWSRQEHTIDDVGRLSHRIATHVQKEGFLPAVRHTWDAEIVDDLKPCIAEDDVVFTKHRASCFYNTTLEPSLRMRGIKTLIVTGVATNYCVDATIRDAYARDYDLVIVGDGCASLQNHLHAAFMENNALFHGVVLEAASVAALLEARQ
jgi:ureidoacrylate peracid hydrolase